MKKKANRKAFPYFFCSFRFSPKERGQRSRLPSVLFSLPPYFCFSFSRRKRAV